MQVTLQNTNTGNKYSNENKKYKSTTCNSK